MGSESAARRKVGTRWVAGKALLETDELIFRGDQPCKVRFKDVTKADADGKRLVLTTAESAFTFELGTDAAPWAAKILNPKTRAQKFGFKPGQQVALSCISDPSFREELEKSGIEPTTHDRGLDAFVVGVGDKTELNPFASWRKRIAPDGSVWVVYPKGRTEVTELDVLNAGRAAGLKDVKVVRFSETHTAFKFVIPLSERP